MDRDPAGFLLEIVLGILVGYVIGVPLVLLIWGS